MLGGYLKILLAMITAYGEGMRLQALLSRSGISSSRRAAEVLIRDGKIMLNRQQARLGDRVAEGDRLQVDGRKYAVRALQAQPRVLSYHKPVGEFTTRAALHGQSTVFDRLPSLANGAWIVVGRLDVNSEGLLLFTDSGELAHRLMHPSRALSREYRVRVRGKLQSDWRQAMLNGVALSDGMAKFDQVEGLPQRHASNHWYRVCLHTGRYREVRRCFAALGGQVNRLIRVAYGPINLPRTLHVGRWEYLNKVDLARLLQAVDWKPSRCQLALRQL